MASSRTFKTTAEWVAMLTMEQTSANIEWVNMDVSDLTQIIQVSRRELPRSRAGSKIEVKYAKSTMNPIALFVHL
eukprot:CAMPEP_0183312646 /NCGR_PEP_ID=MMETSP0160_2-20130417/42440_1 /TAXON_ID=2839 ORGANISM="Odontella Sinensis, Strain Grunow 1884" /NCGR_SAMPLE_ID=MMETSP0160_2 /ASSEMBLY_ACC=CAM_ASM_000250 /LENGTH=74 /DNA_ID=CAMNT_0025477539 /DNA_START=560 /DNA_END=784 /DNA_ORIENTATION=-